MQNLYAERRALADRMAADLQTIEQGGIEIDPVADIDPDTRARLASLGYVGTFVSTQGADRSALADPKDKTEVIVRLTEAHKLLRDDGDPEKALRVLQEVVARDPGVVDVWHMIGVEHTRRDNIERAIEAFKQAVALKPDYALAVASLARAYRELGRDEDALIGYRRLAELTPQDGQVPYEMAEIFLARGELGEAEAHLGKALSLEPTLPAARNALGALRLQQGRLDEAEREIRTALAQKPDLSLAHFNLALIAEERGDLQAAVAEYRKEIELQPDSYRAQFNLGIAYGKLGDQGAQLKAFQQAIESNPQFAEGHFFLAKLYLDLGQRYDEAVRLARKGLALAPRGPFAPLGHYVIAGVYERTGRQAEADRELAKGEQLESSLKERLDRTPVGGRPVRSVDR